MTGQIKSDIGECVYVLFFKLWGKTPIGGRPRSQQWWIKRKEELINQPTITLTLGPEKELDDMPVPFEVEFDLPNKSECVAYFSWLERKKSFDRI